MTDILETSLPRKQLTFRAGRHHWFPHEVTPEGRLQKFHTDDESIPRSGISALVPQTSFGGTGDVAKCRLFFSGQLKTTLGTKKCYDGDNNENVKKEIGWIGKTTTLHVQHAFLSISLPSLHDYDGKMPNFTFYGGRKQATAKFSFSFYTWIWFLGIRLKKSSLAFDVVNELE